MKKSVKLTGPALALAVAGGVWLAGNHPARAAEEFPDLDIRLGTVAVGDPFYHLGSLRFAELVKERTGGAVEVQIFPGEQLGNEKDLIEQVRSNVIQMTITGSPMLSIFPGWGAIGAFAMPYVFKGDTDETRLANLLKVARGEIGEEINRSGIEASGMRALDMVWWAGVQHLATRTQKVTKVDDITDLKIRTPDTPIYRAALEALGAKVTPMAWTEVYTALQLGVVDGMANTPDLIYNAKLHEVQDYLALTGHLAQIQVVVINEDFYQGLSPALQEILQEAAIEAGDYQNALALEKNPEYLQKLEAEGMTITEVDLEEFAETTRNAWKDFEPTFGEGMYEKIVAAQN